jgi:F0F1-type ATP synthase membrane subunit b/b'
MSSAKTIVDAQMQHLLEVVDRRREEHCARVTEEAQEQARQIVRQARRETRSRAHEDLLELREQIRQQLASADAQRLTRQRQQRQQVEQALINATWPQLHDALQRLWDDQNTRRRWVNDLVLQASNTLLNAHWCIDHPPDWPGQECNDLKARLRNEFDCFPSFEPQSAVTAGLRITAGGACVDGSIEGLLQGRTRIEAILLARFREQSAHET